MNLIGKISGIRRPATLAGPPSALILGIWLTCLGFELPLLGEATVTTLGGGRLTPEGPDFGFTDGDILQTSQFHTPFGCAVDPAGRVYVADRDNGALRRLDLAANRARTLLQGLKQPVAVAVDQASVVYVLNRGDGTIQKIDRGVVYNLTGSLSDPTAMAYDGGTNLFVAQSKGSVVVVNTKTKLVSPTFISGLNQPSGIAVLDTGFVAVSETGGHVVRIWDPLSGEMKLQVGVGTPGFADGPASIAQFSRPFQLAKAPGGSLVVADRGNHRVRLIDADGFVTTIYGVDPNTWEGPACVTCNPVILPGWLDGSVEFAEAREPVGVAVGADGQIYTTEVYYHLVRSVTGATFTGGADGSATNIVVLPPSFVPDSGYFPMGQTITVSNPNISSLLPSSVFYTTDGTEPTTNSFRLPMSNGTGLIQWTDKQRDLTSLRVKVFLGANASETVSGRPATATELGVPQPIAGGIGSLAIMPLVLNLRTNDQLQSLQFRVEIQPALPSTPMLRESIQALEISTNDFIPVYSGGENKGAALFRTMPYAFEKTQGLAVTFVGTNANLLIKGFGVAAMLAVPIPPEAHIGDQYTIDIISPSGTSDAAEQSVPIAPMARQSLVVTDCRYLVGDSSTAIWYNGAQLGPDGKVQRGFGDGVLDNSDVNNVFAVSLGLRVPYPNTDLFDAMDVFPEDTVAAAGGDGLIRFLDWQIVLLRSLGLDSAAWERSWVEGGYRLPTRPGQTAAANSPGSTLVSPPPGSVWWKQVTLGAETLEAAAPLTSYDMPVYVLVAPDAQLAGLAFRATLEPDGPAPVLEAPIQFIPAPGIPAPTQSSLAARGTVVCGWPLVPSSAFDPPLRGSNLVGHVRLTIPASAHQGQSYTLRFANADGSPDLQTQYDFETRPASVWVLSAAQRPAERTSDEWKLHFFGSLSSDSARADADPDQDGVPNWAEYLAGTNPTDRHSYLHLLVSYSETAPDAVTLRWLSAPGKIYQIEATQNLSSTGWTVLAENLHGDGTVQQMIASRPKTTTQFYRIRLQP